MRVGIDLVSVDSIREALQTHSERYLERVYTAREVEDCTSSAGVDPERLAARFAAKEATLKALRPREYSIPWSSIEVRRDPGGWVELELTGPAAMLADATGITELSLSITHEGGFAAAVVIACCALGTAAAVR